MVFLSSLVLVTLSLNGCACGALSDGAWKGDPQCVKQHQDAQYNAEQKRSQELPNLKKKADSGNVKAQVEMGFYHVFQRDPGADRVVGLTYYQMAGKQGDVHAQRIFLTETHKDCQAMARKRGLKEADGPLFAPHCVAQWNAVEDLAKKYCARTSLQNTRTSLAVEVAMQWDWGRKSDEADFWYAVSLTHCLTPSERTSFGEKAFRATPSSQSDSYEVRRAMWMRVAGMENTPHWPHPSTEVEAKAKDRLAMLREKVARSGIRPEL